MPRNLILTCGELDGTWLTDPVTDFQIHIADSMAESGSGYSQAAKYIDGRIFVASDDYGFVSCYSVNGEVLWAKFLPGVPSGEYCDFIDLGGGVIAALGSGSRVVKFNATDGSVIADFTAGSQNTPPRYFDNAFWSINNNIGGILEKYDLSGNLIASSTDQYEGAYSKGYVFSQFAVKKVNPVTLNVDWTYDFYTLHGGQNWVYAERSDPTFVRDNGNILVPFVSTADDSFSVVELDPNGLIVGGVHQLSLNSYGFSPNNFCTTNVGPYIAYTHFNKNDSETYPGYNFQTEGVWGIKSDWTLEFLFASDWAYTIQMISFPDVVYAGAVNNGADPANLEVSLLHVPTLKVVDKTVSTGGTYSLKALSQDDHVVICKSPDASKNWQVRAHLTPAV